MKQRRIQRVLGAAAAGAMALFAAAAPATAGAAPFEVATASDGNGTLTAVCEYVIAAGTSSQIVTHGTATAVGPAVVTGIRCDVDLGSAGWAGCQATMPGAVATCTNARSSVFPVGEPALCAEGWVVWANGSILRTPPC